MNGNYVVALLRCKSFDTRCLKAWVALRIDPDMVVAWEENPDPVGDLIPVSGPVADRFTD
jgi:hypothetical protein